MADVIQLRRDTASNWTSANPTLASGELGLETDTGKLKLGTGALVWNSLSYYTLAMFLSIYKGFKCICSSSFFSNSIFILSAY